MRTYILRNQQQEGPFWESQIREMLDAGELPPDTLVWREGMLEWVALPVLYPEVLPPVPAVPAAEAPALWNPNAAANWSLLLSPTFGSLLHYLNWGRLGRPQEQRKALVWVAVSFVVMLAAVIVPEVHQMTMRYVMLGILLGWYFAHAKKQVAVVQELYGKNYPRRSILLAVVLGFVALFFLGMVVGFIMLLTSGELLRQP